MDPKMSHPPRSLDPVTVEKLRKLEQELQGSSARTEDEPFDLTQIPMRSLVRVGQIFAEGEKKYGRDNWRQGAGDIKFQRKRLNKAIKHLLIYTESLLYGKHSPEDDLAKVLWFCLIQMELERSNGVDLLGRPSSEGLL